MTIRQFEQEDPKKYIIAQQFDVFRWTLPTILTTGRDMFARIALKFCSKSFPELENETL